MSRFDEVQTPFVLVEREQLTRIQQLATQLYREERLNGDQMRDMGHALMGVLDSVIPFDGFDDSSVAKTRVDVVCESCEAPIDVACPCAEGSRT